MLRELAFEALREAGRIEAFIAAAVRDRRATGVVVGLSGGIDSAVVAALCARALSPARVFALFLPERDSAPASAADARAVAEAFGFPLREEDLTPALEALGCYRSAGARIVRARGLARAAVRAFPRQARERFAARLAGEESAEMRAFAAFYHMKHRVRLVRCCREAEERGALVASCANRTERETGFFVRYGDDGGDIAPIVGLYKTQVRALGAALDLPRTVLEKAPSPDLFAGVADEEILGMPYETLDAILCLVDAGAADGEIVSRAGADAEAIAYVRRIAALSGPLRSPPLAPPPVEKA